MPYGAKVEETPDIDLSTWSWGSNYYTTFGRIASEVIRNEFAKSGPDLFLGYQYSDRRERGVGPADLILTLPLGANVDESPEWKFSLFDLVRDLVDYFEAPADGKIYPESDGVEIVRAIIRAFRDAADDLEGRLVEGEPNDEAT